MPTRKYKNYFVSLLLSIIAAVAVAFVWNYGVGIFKTINGLVAPENSALSISAFLLLIGFCLAIGFAAENLSSKRLSGVLLPSALIGIIASAAAAYFFQTDLRFLPLLFAAGTVTTLVHLKKMWVIDSELTDKLVFLASAGHLLEGKSADLRIESGLKLLETVLPLSESIVFRLESNGELRPLCRATSETAQPTDAERNSKWRKNIELCEQALKARETVAVHHDKRSGAADAAIPLIYEKTAIGVLFVRIKKNFEPADLSLLEAFSGQLAQNFQRRELRQKSLPHQHWWSSFSTQSAENRLDIISLVHGIIKEQSFSAIASSYLREAHAIAYLDGTLAYLNRQMRHLAKIGPHEFYEIDLFSLLDRFRTDVFNEPNLAIRRVLQSGEDYRGELFFPNENLTLKMQISLVKVPSGSDSIHETNVPLKPACFLITFRDISAVKENEKLRSDMASLMSHELRTPITSIQGFAEIMLADETLSEDSREFLQIIANESHRLSKMLTTFLSVSNLEQSDKKEVSKVPVKLDSVVSEVVSDLQETAKRKRIRLVEKSNSHLPPIAADKGLISRAISSLIDNAIRYSPERTSVIISTMLESDFLRVVVEDRGYGIHSSEHDKIWQKFYRVARDGFDKQEESTGLGLSLVKEIIEQHGGDVEVESEVGRGSKFSLKLPRL
ncbi:MAG: hypothetical protein KIS76_05670 [Pyrinomonadaceae bacterium]|nr:hypothetical protein [Pyrinomonadaceae bacterium]